MYGNIFFCTKQLLRSRFIFAQGAGKRPTELPDSDRSFPTPGKTQVTNVSKCIICLIRQISNNDKKLIVTITEMSKKTNNSLSGVGKKEL